MRNDVCYSWFIDNADKQHMKTQYIQIRNSQSDRERWESAANKQGLTLSEFLRRAADERAKKVERANKEWRK